MSTVQQPPRSPPSRPDEPSPEFFDNLPAEEEPGFAEPAETPPAPDDEPTE